MAQTNGVDITGFIEAVKTQLNIVKNIPELEKCDNAWNNIYESLDILEDGFDRYYNEVISSGNPNALIEGFISDVAINQEYNKFTSIQLRKILDFYKAKESVTDPTLMNLLNQLEDTTK